MALNVDSLATSMLASAKGPLGKNWKVAEPFAQTEFKIIAQKIVDIEAQLAAGTIDQAQATLLLGMQKDASRSVLLAVEGIGLLAAEEAINAALGAVATMVNGALKFSLL